MAIAATIKYFGRFPTTIVLQSSSNFDGSAQTGAPVITPGLYVFPVQAAGGLFAYHEDPIEIKQIAYAGSGTLTVTKVVGNPGGPTIMTSVVETVSGATPIILSNFFLSPGEYLTFSTSGGGTKQVSVTSHMASYAADGAC